jgi:SAM-dependent methyltransferase
MYNLNHLVELKRDNFIRERISPRQGDFYYLHLSDLLLALKSHSTSEHVRVLDFGCGGSPYRSLFPNAEYFRADLDGAQDVDFEISEAGKTNAPDESFDLVLSTQVLEHCTSPQTYIRECHRILKKDGKLLLTTHGLFEEHSCPVDFHRWTEDGLRALLTESDFAVDSIVRVTVGPRAGFQLLQSSLSQSYIRDRAMYIRLILWPLWRILLARRGLWDPLLDAIFPEYRVSGPRRLPGDNFYISLLAVATPV